jgi:hypothetical protein
MEIENSVDPVDPQPEARSFPLTKEMVAKLAIGGCVLSVVAFFCVAIGSLWSQMDIVPMQPSMTAIAGMALSVACAMGSMTVYAWTTLAPASVRAEYKRERAERRRSRRNRGGTGGRVDGTAVGAAAAAAATAVLVTNMGAQSSMN